MGEKGSIIFKSKSKSFFEFPAVTNITEDTVGVGDAYFALSSLFAFVEKLETVAFVGNAAGGLKFLPRA